MNDFKGSGRLAHLQNVFEPYILKLSIYSHVFHLEVAVMEKVRSKIYFEN